jgi:dipeptide transport system ATP-binding protein
MALILITHDMGVIAETVDRVVVQYAGQQVEAQAVEGLFADAMHPYTAALLAALPERSKARLLPTIAGVVPGVLDRPAGCLFSPRCALATDHCRRDQPAFRDGPRGRVRCHYPLTRGVPEGHPGQGGLAA